MASVKGSYDNKELTNKQLVDIQDRIRGREDPRKIEEAVSRYLAENRGDKQSKRNANSIMPELFPGTIVKFKEMGVNFYCNEVTHSFDYSGGFSTSANLMAPSTDASDGYNFGLAMAKPPFKTDVEGKVVTKPVPPKPKVTKKKTTKRGG